MPHSYSRLLFHVVFSTKDRTRSIDTSIRSDLFAYMGGIVREIGGSARIINGTADHVHMLLILPTDVSVAECLRIVKTNASRWLHESFPDHRYFAWQTGYAAFAVSASNESEVARYIANQEQHHHKTTFQEEFLALLRKHGVAFDERYVWT